MAENEDLLLHPEALVIRADPVPGVPFVTHDGTEMSGALEDTNMQKPDPIAETTSPGVSSPGPIGMGVSQAPTHTPSAASQLQPPCALEGVPEAPGGPSEVAGSPVPGSDDQLRPFVKLPGRQHPWKPRTPAQIAEFAALWRSPLYSLDQIARRYRCGKRTIQKWRVEFGLPPRDQLQRLEEQGATVADAAGQVVAEMKGAAAAMTQISKAQAVLGIELGLRKAGEGHDPAPDKNWDPLQDPEVVQGLADIREEARRMTADSDLGELQRRLARLSLLCATKAPVQTWESLQSVVDALARSILWTRKVEAELPPPERDQTALRKAAAAQMMHELREVLNPEEQNELARIVKLGADRLLRSRQCGSHPDTPHLKT